MADLVEAGGGTVPPPGLLARQWDRMQLALARERSWCLQTLASGGLAAVFAGVSATIRWTVPILEVDVQPVVGLPTDVVSAGRGLCLAPSIFCGSLAELYTPLDPERPLLLLTRRCNPSGLEAVHGRTRSRLLSVVAERATTSMS